jgi:phospholipid/cholesterol/gamma-HCH transport system ATP-binding protein
MDNQRRELSAAVLVKDLRKSFGSEKVLDGIGFQVDSGETVAVLGRSGTGKSVLLKLLIGLLKPDSGSIRIHGQEITGLDLVRMNEIRKKIGFLFQQAALYDSLTIEENVAFPLTRHTSLSATERRDRVRELLAQVGMEGDLKKLPSEISGGMQKRVGLARALALDPDLLLFDEPTTGLDPITASEIVDLILQLKEERRVASVVVTHDIHAARSFSDRLVVIKEGHILTEGTFADLQGSKDKFVARFLSEAA